jgi:hypothetical protein
MESFIKNVSKIKNRMLTHEEAQSIVTEIWDCNEPALLIYAAKAIDVNNDAILMAKIRVVENHFRGMVYKHTQLYNLFALASSLVKGHTSDGRVSDVVEEMKMQLSRYEDMEQDEYAKTMDMIRVLEDASIGYVTEAVDRKRFCIYAVKEAICSEIGRVVSNSVNEKLGFL